MSHAAAAAAAGAVVERVEPRRSPADTRSYVCLTLANGLAVTLVSDPAAVKAAAAMLVDVGNLADPDGLPGLAHYLEHMLFLGSEAYPDEQAYRRFLAEHAGSCNASTDASATVYHFDVAAAQLRGALEIFLAFFRAPLFDPSCAEREVTAVNNEHSKNLQSDGRRLYQLMRSTAWRGHPFARFGSGNRETLATAPAAAGVDVRAALLAFHKRYYVARRMRLAVVGREPLAELEALVLAAKLHEISNAGCHPDDAMPLSFVAACAPPPPAPLPWCDGTAQLLRVVPAAEQRSLRILFPLHQATRTPAEREAVSYLCSLLGHEGKGSLLSALRTHGWAAELSAGPWLDEADFAVLSLTISLTPAGLAAADDVVALVFAVIGSLERAGPQAAYHAELAAVATARFLFAERGDARATVQALVESMRHHAPADVLIGPVLYGDFAAMAGVAHSALLPRLTPDHVRVVLIAREHADVVHAVEPWYGTRYDAGPVAPDVVVRWRAARAAPAPADVHLPEPNAFIATRFDLAPLPALVEWAPRMLRDDGVLRLLHQRDACFLRPRTFATALVHLPVDRVRGRGEVTLALLQRFWRDGLKVRGCLCVGHARAVAHCCCCVFV